MSRARPAKARADHVVRATLDDRGHHVSELLGCVLAIGVEEGDGRRSPFSPPREARAHGGAETAVPVERVDGGAGGSCQGGGPVGGTVVDHHDLDGVPVYLARRAPDDIGNGGFLVVRWQHHDNGAAAGKLRIVHC